MADYAKLLKAISRSKALQKAEQAALEAPTGRIIDPLGKEAQQLDYNKLFQALPQAEKSAAESAEVFSKQLPNFELKGSPYSGNLPAVRPGLPDIPNIPPRTDINLPALRPSGIPESIARPVSEGMENIRDVTPRDFSQESNALKRLLQIGAAGTAAGGIYGLSQMSGDQKAQLEPSPMVAGISPDQEVKKETPEVPQQSGFSKLQSLLKSGAVDRSEVKPMLELDLGTGEDYKAQLQAAQEARRNIELVGGLGKAAEQIGAAIGGYKPTAQGDFERIIASGKRPLEELEQRRAIEKDDPNSPISKAFKQYAEKFGVKIKGDFSASAAEKIMPMVYKAYEAEEARKAKKEDQAYRYEQLKTAKEIAAQQKLGQRQEDFISKANKDLVKTKQYAALDKISGANRVLDQAIKGQSSAGDIAALYSFVKALDPDSAVREGEISLSREAASLWGNLQTKFSKLGDNPRVIPTDVLQDMKKYIHEMERSYRDSYDRVRNPILKQAERRGISAEDFDMIDPLYENKREMQSNRKVIRKGFNEKTNQTQLIYDDGSKEIVEGKR